MSDEDLRGLFRTEDAGAALARLRSFNPAARVLLTRGAQGAELHVGRAVHRQASPQVDVVDTVGAGDAAMGGWLYSLMTQADAPPEAHLKFAVAAGTAACLSSGAVPPDLAAVHSLLHRM